MHTALWLVPLAPLAGFLALVVAGRRLPGATVGAIGVGSVGTAMACSLGIAVRFLLAPPPGGVFDSTLGGWIEAGPLHASLSLRLDALSLVMLLVVTVVGFLIHLYSSAFMREDDGYARFFAYMNLFVSMMSVLVLAADFVLLYLGWEGVGLCSFLLIGFWYRDRANAAAARKAFLVTRIGDAAMALGLFLLFSRAGTLEIAGAMTAATAQWAPGSVVAVAAATLLLAGAVGKSAQLPLQVWLPDAMAGPTPVSALIHAATMVTAGVYLIARTHALFLLAPAVLLAVALIGVLTMLLAGASALAQTDIKRILAYSTISQVGYMFIALGVGAWSAAVFHLLTHAMFKALLFLGAGVVIRATDGEHDIFRMGGLRTRLPFAFWTLLAAGASLAGLPLVTAGFYSKESILSGAFATPAFGPWLWSAGVLGAGLTALYAFRMIFVVFFGEVGIEPVRHPGGRIRFVLVSLAVGSIAGGLLETPRVLGGIHRFSSFVERAVPASPTHATLGTEVVLSVAAAIASLAGLGLAWIWFRRRGGRLPDGSLRSALAAGWGFDAAYDAVVVRPFVRLAGALGPDPVERLPSGAAAAMRAGFRVVRGLQDGRIRRYASGIAVGAAIALALALVLS